MSFKMATMLRNVIKLIAPIQMLMLGFACNANKNINNMNRRGPEPQHSDSKPSPRDPAKVDWNPCIAATDDVEQLAVNKPETIDFARDIKPVLDSSCVSCHPQYSDYEATAKSGGLILKRLQLPAEDPKVMPKDAPVLSPEDIAKFKYWQIANYPNHETPIPNPQKECQN